MSKFGLKIKTSKSGERTGYWVAANCSRKAKKYPRPVVRLHGPESGWLDACQALHAELQNWIIEQSEPSRPRSFDGSIGGLIDQYTGHELSPYHKVKHNTRERYDWEHKVLRKAVGARQLAKLAGLDFIRWHTNFAQAKIPGGAPRPARAHDLMSAVRRIVSWGVVLGLPHSDRLARALGELEFAEPSSRSSIITYEQAAAIIARAHEVGRPSIAMAQALQYDLNLRQIDVIGEWVVDIDNTNGIRNNVKNTRQPKRWTTGLTWSHIDDLILSKLISKTARRTKIVATFDLRTRPLALAEIEYVPYDQRIGPLVKNEETGLPYTGSIFRERWRAIADDCGVPKHVQNRDSRAGGITEARNAGASLPQIMGDATHSKPSTTARYMRDNRAATDTVGNLRVLHRQNRVRTGGAK